MCKYRKEKLVATEITCAVIKLVLYIRKLRQKAQITPLILYKY